MAVSRSTPGEPPGIDEVTAAGPTRRTDGAPPEWLG
jgi:hypothetical protein